MREQAATVARAVATAGYESATRTLHKRLGMPTVTGCAVISLAVLVVGLPLYWIVGWLDKRLPFNRSWERPAHEVPAPPSPALDDPDGNDPFDFFAPDPVAEHRRRYRYRHGPWNTL